VVVDQAELKQAIELGEEDFFPIWQNGPEVTRWDTFPVQVGDTAPGLALPDQTGTTVGLGAVLAAGAAVVLFWHHFACGYGVERVQRLRDELANYRATGASILIIGQRPPVQAAAFGEERELDLPILTDHDRPTHRAYGLPDTSLPQANRGIDMCRYVADQAGVVRRVRMRDRAWLKRSGSSIMTKWPTSLMTVNSMLYVSNEG
jgi:peroxiredoxin